MAKRKIKLTRTELKQQRDALARFNRYLPTLKLKQQQVQSSIVQTRQLYHRKEQDVNATQGTISHYDGLFNDAAGVNFIKLAAPESVNTSTHSIAGVHVPQFERIAFPKVNLFEKVMIPNTQDNIRRIRIALGDQMTAGVARAKIAKAKLEQKEQKGSMEAAAL
jgi:V/A-type H+-transporting ATPase subunit D